MAKKDDGGQAFPRLKTSLMRDHLDEPRRFTHDYETEQGMTLREWFAGQALAGLCANPELIARGHFENVAVDAYRFADAMIAERNRDNG